eukprot:jgi/Picre1/33363/NNA_008687.t1
MYEGRKVVIVIPARIGSKRVKRKALVDIEGVSMITHVYMRTKMNPIVDEVIVATDSNEIILEIERQGGKTFKSQHVHQNGTERASEVCATIYADIYVVIFGDEPLLDPLNITDVVSEFSKKEQDMCILSIPYSKCLSPSDVKIVSNSLGEVLYLSRADIPYGKFGSGPRMLQKAYHIAAFTKHTLLEFKRLGKSPLEEVEDIEHLRLIEHGFKIRHIEVSGDSISVDTEEDLEFVRSKMRCDNLFQAYKHLVN